MSDPATDDLSRRLRDSKVVCAACGGQRVRVIDSRHTREHIRRRRHCELCGHRWSTYEIPAERYAQLLEDAHPMWDGLHWSIDEEGPAATVVMVDRVDILPPT